MTETSIHLIVRRTIRASAERLFEAWTTPEQLRQWWGPAGVTCSAAEVDLRVGGRYRLGNALPSGDTGWISGEFERIVVPTELVYTWSIEPATRPPERVTVRFEEVEGRTEVVVVHERISTEASRTEHQRGWVGCLDGLHRLYEPRSGQ